MKHRVSVNPLGRKPAHRKALHRNMVTSLFAHERIRTTKAKAQAVRRTAEKMITRAKVDSVHNRRIIFKDIKDDAVLAKLFTDIGPRFQDRAGGYTRILKLGQRRGDASEMVLLELVERAGGESEKPKRQRRAKQQPKQQQTEQDEEASQESPEESASKEATE